MALPTKEDFATEVRTDRLKILWQFTLTGTAIAVMILLVVGIYLKGETIAPFVHAMIALIVSCALTPWLLKRARFIEAVWAFALGWIVAAAALLLGGDLLITTMIPFFFPIIIFITGLLLPPSHSLTMTILCAGIVIFAPTQTGLPGDVLLPYLIIAIVLMSISALFAAQVTGELYQIAEWALMNYQRQRQTNEELFEKRLALQKSLTRSEALSDQLKETNVELEAAHAAAEEAKHFRGQFLANMSHELRTPLNAIIGFSETMLQFPLMYDNVPLPDMYNNDMNQIYNSGRQLLHVINDILDLAKVDAGKLDVLLQKVNAEPVILAVLSTAKGLIGNKPVELEKDLPETIPDVWVDETRLRQVLLNLYSNATKFTDKGSIKLTVKEVEEGVQFSVSDTGIGIAPEHQELIFEEFTQASDAGRDPRSGAGLGLTISRQLLALMQGRIWVESEVGKGSTFHFIVQKYVGQEDTRSTRPQTLIDALDSMSETDSPKEDTTEESVPQESVAQSDTPKVDTPAESVPQESAAQSDTPKVDTAEESVPQKSAAQSDTPKADTPAESVPQESVAQVETTSAAPPAKTTAIVDATASKASTNMPEV